MAGLVVERERAQLLQQAHAVLNITLIGRFDEGKGGDIAQTQRRHLQDHRRQVGAQDLRIGKGRTAEEVIFRIETDTDAVGDTAAASFTLIGRGLGNRLDRQTLHLGAIAVAADARGAGIDHIFNAGHGQGGFRHVGRQHDASSAVRLKNPVLLGVGQARVERQNFGMRQVALRQRVGGVANFALAAHKDKNIAAPFVTQLVDRVENRLQLIALAVVRLFHHRPVAYFHREGAARNLNYRRIMEVARKALRIDGRRGNDDFQIGTARQQLAQVAEQEIDIQAALVRLIDNDGVILQQQTILLNFRQQDAVSHQLHLRGVADLIVKAHFIADAAAERGFQLLGDAVGDGARRQTTRLRMADQPFNAASQRQTDFWQLSGFARAGFPGDNHYLMIADRLGDLLLLLTDRQVVGKGNFWRRGGSGGDALFRRRDLLAELVDDGLQRRRISHFTGATQAALQALAVAQRQIVESRPQRRERRGNR